MRMKKILKWQSIRTKIFIILFSFIAFAGILIGINSHFYAEKDKLNKKLAKLSEFETTVNKAVYFQNLIFLKDFTTIEYYQKKNSFNEVSYKNNIIRAEKLLKKFDSKKIQKSQVVAMFYNQTKEELKKIDHYFNKIVYLQKTRGFRDAGMEGRMRKKAHFIESHLQNDNQKLSLLQMRRHEKDYFMRGDNSYAEKLRLESLVLRSKLNSANKELLQNLNEYYTTFDSIQVIDNLTGLKNGKGYANLLNIYTSQLNYSVNNLYKEYKDIHKDSLLKIEYLRVFATVILILIAIIISALISSSITVRVRKLSDFMNKYVANKFRIQSRFEPDLNNDEISALIKNFKILEDEITVEFEKYKVRVASRTEEIISQKTEIEKQNAIIAEKNEELIKQKNVLDFQNHHILDSLKAAKELQKTFFPSNEKLNKLLGNFHLRFEPLDIVSGDFYWVEQNENGLYIAVADCTGHGAHGALMSINGIHLLNHAIRDKKIKHTDEVLNYLSEKIHTQFYTGEDSLKHTLDIALIRIDNLQLEFAGAQRDVTIVKNEELVELSGDRRPLGWSVKNKLHQFTAQKINLSTKDIIVMYTDGITDQFGGLNNKKFKKAPFLELLKKASVFEFNEFCEVVSETFDNWKDDTNQTDDITFLAIKAEAIVNNAELVTKTIEASAYPMQISSFTKL